MKANCTLFVLAVQTNFNICEIKYITNTYIRGLANLQFLEITYSGQNKGVESYPFCCLTQSSPNSFKQASILLLQGNA
ncbi:hypothetical protein DFP79_3300 [Marinomonas balearica]|uniref:Uncharacterized protein n=1 Tax=Marinomonas balearica TaxID=491947 RepID=A0A4R6M3R8_9GAMM|nr:hypothetical protein DFP79_3300 [Marinomonas balearica]